MRKITITVDDVTVALRKESVDRNSAIVHIIGHIYTVALRKESVDRNIGWLELFLYYQGRSPQGERG